MGTLILSTNYLNFLLTVLNTLKIYRNNFVIPIVITINIYVRLIYIFYKLCYV